MTDQSNEASGSTASRALTVLIGLAVVGATLSVPAAASPTPGSGSVAEDPEIGNPTPNCGDVNRAPWYCPYSFDGVDLTPSEDIGSDAMFGQGDHDCIDGPTRFCPESVEAVDLTPSENLGNDAMFGQGDHDCIDGPARFCPE